MDEADLEVQAHIPFGEFNDQIEKSTNQYVSSSGSDYFRYIPGYMHLNIRRNI